MFIELQAPCIVDIYGTDRLKIRLREPGMPGRIWLTLSYKDKKEAVAAVREILVALEAGVQEYIGPRDVKELPK